MKEIGRRVQELRGRARLSYRQLAERADVSHGYIQYLEQGARQKLDMTKLGRVAQALGVALSEIVGAEAYEDDHRYAELDELADIVPALSREDREVLMTVARRLYVLQQLHDRGVTAGPVSLRESGVEDRASARG